MEEKVVRKRRAYTGKMIHLDVMDVETPDQRIHQREIVVHPGAVAVVPYDTGNVILVRQYRLAARQLLLEIPAGKLEPGEPPQLTAERELQEEAGFKPGTLTPLDGLWLAPGYSDEYIHMYLATNLVASSLKADDDEFIEIVRLPLAEALDKITSGEIQDAKTVAGLLRAARHLNAV